MQETIELPGGKTAYFWTRTGTVKGDQQRNYETRVVGTGGGSRVCEQIQFFGN